MHANTEMPIFTSVAVANPATERRPASVRIAGLLRTAFLAVVAASVVLAVGSLAWAQYQDHLFLTGQHPSQQAVECGVRQPGIRTMPATPTERTDHSPSVVSLFAI